MQPVLHTVITVFFPILLLSGPQLHEGNTMGQQWSTKGWTRLWFSGRTLFEGKLQACHTLSLLWFPHDGCSCFHHQVSLVCLSSVSVDVRCRNCLLTCLSLFLQTLSIRTETGKSFMENWSERHYPSKSGNHEFRTWKASQVWIHTTESPKYHQCMFLHYLLKSKTLLTKLIP